LFRAEYPDARPFPVLERWSGAVVVFELHHRLTLLEPFKITHKGKIARSNSFIDVNRKVNVRTPLMRRLCGSATNIT
jgi:hypothetical protein